MLTDPEGPLPYIVLGLLLLFSAFFSGSEAAFSYCNRHRMKVKVDDGSKIAKLVLKILDKFDNTIISILVATNIAHIASSVLSTILAVNIFKNSNVSDPSAWGSTVSTIIITVVVFLFCEILPKSIAKTNSDKWSMVVAIPIYGLMIILWPIAQIFNGLIFLVRKLFKVKDEENVFTEDDFQDVVEQIEEEGVIDEEESDIIQAAVDFGDILVKDVLTKRDDIVALNIKDCKSEYVKQFLLQHNYSRIPVYEDSINNIIGILHVRSYLKQVLLNKRVSVKTALLKPYFVSPKITLDEIFEGFKENKTHIAIVKDKDKTIGMVTMKDVLEELVEDIDEAGSSPEEGGVINA